MRIKDVELRTGLTAKEVGQFGFAARAAGQDISIFERMMRGLSQAADDTSKEGEKARATMQRIGVTMVDAHTGALKPTRRYWRRSPRVLNGCPPVLSGRGRAGALQTCGRGGIPVITELTENLESRAEKGYGPSEEDVKRFTEYQREVTEVEMSWETVHPQHQGATGCHGLGHVQMAGHCLGHADAAGKILGQKLFGGKPRRLTTSRWGKRRAGDMARACPDGRTPQEQAAHRA